MKNFFDKFKIPTLLGLSIIFIGIITGVYLVLKEQIIISRASLDTTPIKDSVIFTNIEALSVVLSWQTANPVASFVSYNASSGDEQTILDDRDQTTPNPHIFHYFTLKNLLPQTEYQLKIVSNGKPSQIFHFKTAPDVTNLNNLNPVIGSVLEENKQLDEGVVYLSISGATIQSSLIKNSGSFLIPLTQIRKNDLSDTLFLSDETTAKLTVISKNNQATALIKLEEASVTLPVLKMGQNIDLTTDIKLASEDLTVFDINKDNQINATDFSLVLKNKIDLNRDGVFNQKDLDLMSKQINQ